MDFLNMLYQRNTAAIYAAPLLGKKDLLLKKEKFTVKDLSAKEIDILFAVGGGFIEDVAPLTEGQAWIFSNDTVLSENFYLQALFKVGAFIPPQQFNEHVERLIKKKPILRTLFLRGDAGRPLQVVLKSRLAEIRFHDLSGKSADELNQSLEKIMAADRRRGFDLKKDRLLRIGVFRTGNRTYAVMVAQPQIVADGWDIGDLFAGIFFEADAGDEAIHFLPQKNFSFQEYLHKRSEQDKEPALQYWEKLLHGLGKISQVPGRRAAEFSGVQAVSTISIESPQLRDIQRLAKDDTELIAFMQAAWGLMLQQYNRSNDAVFGVILSNRSARMENIEATASIINVMPVRVTCPIDMTAEELLRKLQMQMVVSRPYSYCQLQELQALSGSAQPIFNHFLNFHSFGIRRRYTDVAAVPGIVPVCVNAFHCCCGEFAIYFRKGEDELQMEFAYDGETFTKAQIRLLQQGFLAVLRQISQKPHMQVCEIKMPSIEQIEAAAVDTQTQKELVRNFFAGIALFKNLSEIVLSELVQLASMEYFVEDDVIVSEGSRQETLYVLYSGCVEISRAAENGWSKSLKLLKKGSVLGYEGIVSEQLSSVRAEAVLGDVQMLAIPNKALSGILRKNFDFVINIVSELNDQVNKLQKLWVNMR